MSQWCSARKEGVNKRLAFTRSSPEDSREPYLEKYQLHLSFLLSHLHKISNSANNPIL